MKVGQNLYDIAYLNRAPLEYAVNHLETGFKNIMELSEYLQSQYKEDPSCFVKRGNRVEMLTQLKSNGGKEMVAVFVPNENDNKKQGQDWALVSIEEQTKDLLYEFAICPDFNPKFGGGTGKLEDLSNLALEEDWGKNNIALEKYIKYTFHYLKNNEPSKIVETDSYAAFNTGLVSRGLWMDIYALFEKVNSPTEGKPKYKLLSFCNEGIDDGLKLSNYFSDFPEKANYFTSQNAAEILIFDCSKEIHPNLKHIIFDGLRRKRFPKAFLDLLKINNKDINNILDNDNFEDKRIQECAHRLKAAIDHAKKRASQNYKIALPMYYPNKNIMSFLLPIVLGEDLDGKVDLALVVNLVPAGRYVAQTVLTLPMAYADSRLICKPSNEWLEINKDSDIPEDE